MSSSMSELTVAALSLETQDFAHSRYIPIDRELINYGTAGSNLEGFDPEKKYYVTTAIAYTNGYPHMGHAYEFLTTDALARYHRILGYDTYFLTGADEHGQKVAASAEKAGLSPKAHCDIYVNAFKALNQRLCVSFDQYIRTTDSRHKATAQALWKKCAEQDDIYLDRYEGWYNEREEAFVTEAEAKEMDYKDGGVPLKKVTEESYFFRMSKFCERLIRYIEENPLFIQPDIHRNSILNRLKVEGLRDLSLSRTSFSWGIAMPEGFDSRHVMYVWFDALSNYISGIDVFDNSSPLNKYWPAQHHIIGKDIIWFHCVIWPCMLMSAGLSLPEKVFAHGFVNAADGRKMSKSYDNAVDPLDVLDKFPLETVRYYFCTSVYGNDLNYTEAIMILNHNKDLKDVFGNLVHRGMTLGHKVCNGVIPDSIHDPAMPPLPFDLAVLIHDIEEDMKTCSLKSALDRTMDAVRATNKWLYDAEPWKMKGDDAPRQIPIVRTTLELIYAFTHFLAPILPISAKAVFTMLGTAPKPAFALNTSFYNLVPGTQLGESQILFQHYDGDEKLKESGKTKGSSGISTVKEKKLAAQAIECALDHDQPDFMKIDLRVGKIVKVWHHETAEKLFCEEIDVGEETLRPIASGLRYHYTLDDMLNRLVVVVCNLKEAKMQGFVSTGMVLAAKNEDGTKIELVDPPANAVVGDRLIIEGMQGAPFPAAKVKKLKLWEIVSSDLKTDESCKVCWKSLQIVTEKGGGCFTVPSNAMAPIG